MKNIIYILSIFYLIPNHEQKCLSDFINKISKKNKLNESVIITTSRSSILINKDVISKQGYTIYINRNKCIKINKIISTAKENKILNDLFSKLNSIPTDTIHKSISSCVNIYSYRNDSVFYKMGKCTHSYTDEAIYLFNREIDSLIYTKLIFLK